MEQKSGGPEQEEVRVIQLQKKLTIYEVNDLREKLLASKAKELILDLGRVEECDAAGIQLLIALGKNRDNVGMKIPIERFSDPVRNAMQSVGVEARDLLEG